MSTAATSLPVFVMMSPIETHVTCKKAETNDETARLAGMLLRNKIYIYSLKICVRDSTKLMAYLSKFISQID